MTIYLFHNATYKCNGVRWSHLKCMIVCDLAEYFTHIHTPTNNEERLVKEEWLLHLLQSN